MASPQSYLGAFSGRRQDSEQARALSRLTDGVGDVAGERGSRPGFFDEIARASRTDFDTETTIARIAEFWDAGIEWDTSAGPALDISGIYLGAEEAKQWCREWFTAREALDFEHQSLDAGEQVVTLLDLRMRGRTSGVEVTLGKHAWVITFRRGLMLRVELYMSQADALKAAVPLQPRHAGRPNV